MLSLSRKKIIDYKIDKNPKQEEAIDIMAENEVTLLEGGGRSGKTFIILYGMVLRALMVPESKHLAVRYRFNHIKQAICYETMPRVLTLLGYSSAKLLNKTDWFYEFPNHSSIWIGGIDDKERTEKILGNEYSTIFLNEASQLSYEVYEILLTRLNPSGGLTAKMWIDYNPPSIYHWGYKMFHKREYPDGRKVGDKDFGKIKMNPEDNKYNDPGYLRRLEGLSEQKRRRFLKGEYSIDSGKYWKRTWIKYRDKLEDFIRVVVAVDPSGTVEGDEVGIIAAGEVIFADTIYYWILDDYSCHGTPAEWSAEVAAAYNKWSADLVVAEKNYGGDMVKFTIESSQKLINVKLVTASRGKIVRAEPISALYERGRVFHREPFMLLEDEYCMYDPLVSKSPNRLDAAVFALTELAGETLSMFDVI